MKLFSKKKKPIIPRSETHEVQNKKIEQTGIQRFERLKTLLGY